MTHYIPQLNESEKSVDEMVFVRFTNCILGLVEKDKKEKVIESIVSSVNKSNISKIIGLSLEKKYTNLEKVIGNWGTITNIPKTKIISMLIESVSKMPTQNKKIILARILFDYIFKEDYQFFINLIITHPRFRNIVENKLDEFIKIKNKSKYFCEYKATYNRITNGILIF